MSGPESDYFARLYRGSDDPYGVGTRWYEERKCALLMASLPRRRYRSAYEPACGVGVLTLALADRCDQVLASDFDARAVDLARDRARTRDNVRVEQHVLPAQWPRDDGPFDLIVLSEIGYFLDEASMRATAACCGDALALGGSLVACHWRPDFEERTLSTLKVHAILAELRLPRLLRHEEDDFILEVWSRDPRSVAQQEGIR
ncbi:bifunctional 2-polyprenyl-6-hydroxyphenol methylase/3-demethylubiquinol 3-O-methyltransferase UbiG [Variovorax sp. KK3]|uniref:class I SAM-dependent methyltransferase n=1 Tax=Variovorax sp. KK3 TaxID=1855728 RepID=UPI00097BCF25|nr:class I SAM-dependent methyltransferase [Variovorax sp. KK3]